jgi:radical SAM superfamily enzyme YgiQ (UPF0313 family)
MGGPHATLYPKETVDNPAVDYVIFGEGEFAFRDLLICLRDGKNPEGIQGVVTKHTDTSSLRIQHIEDLDALLPVPFHLLNFDNYSSPFIVGGRVATLMSSQGCPGRCTFCDRPQMGKKFRKHSAVRVVDEIERCVKDWGITDITFYDDTFTVDKQRVIDICSLIKERRIKVSLDLRARIDSMNAEMIESLAEAGCRRIHYGVESGDENIQKIIKKNVDFDLLRQVVKKTKTAGIETLGYFMLGLPGEKQKEIEKTLDLMCAVPFDYANIGIFMPFPGTAIYNEALAKGMYKEDFWREFARNPREDFQPPFWNENFTDDELVEFMRIAYRRFYSRPSYLLKRLSKLKSLGDFYKKARIGGRLLLSAWLPKKQRGKNPGEARI